MDLLALFIVASLIGGGMVAWVAIWTTNRASNAAITRYFKASEHLSWKRESRRQTGCSRPPGDGCYALLPFSAADETVIARLDELIRFFEHCSFYEDEFAREQHLSQLESVREAWQSGKIP